jgi:hypothetical protein
MRVVRFFLGGLLLAAAVAALSVVALHNRDVVARGVSGTSLRLETGTLVASAVALGAVLALLQVLPGRLAAAARSRRFHHRAQSLSHEHLHTRPYRAGHGASLCSLVCQQCGAAGRDLRLRPQPGLVTLSVTSGGSGWQAPVQRSA